MRFTRHCEFRSQFFNLQWNPTRWHQFMFDWPSKCYTRLFCYGHIKRGIEIGNNWGGQLENPIWMGIFWDGLKLRWAYHNSLSKKYRKT